MFDRLQAMWQRTFLRGQESVAREIDTKLYEQEQEQSRRIVAATEETLELADKLGKDGDPYKEQIGNILKRSIVGSLKGMEERAEGKDQLERTSSSPSLGESKGPSSQTSRAEVSTQMERSDLSAEATERTKRKRGRPSKADIEARRVAERHTH